MRIKIRYYTCSSMFIIMLIIIPRITEREGWTSFSEKGTDRHERIVSTKLERCSTLYRLVASVDLHNYRARFETAEFLKKKEKIVPHFFTLFPTHSYRQVSFSTRSFSQDGKTVAGEKIVLIIDWKRREYWISKFIYKIYLCTFVSIIRKTGYGANNFSKTILT